MLVKEGIGVLGMKSMASGAILKSKTVTAVECLHYAMSLPTSVVITGIDSMDILKQDLEVVKTFEPLTEEQTAALLKKTAEAAAEGKYELFKTSNPFDAHGEPSRMVGLIRRPFRHASCHLSYWRFNVSALTECPHALARRPVPRRHKAAAAPQPRFRQPQPARLVSRGG